MALPNRTSAERAADLAAATAARHERAQMRDRIKAGDLSVRDVLGMRDNPIVSRMKVETLIESLLAMARPKPHAPWTSLVYHIPVVSRVLESARRKRFSNASSSLFSCNRSM